MKTLFALIATILVSFACHAQFHTILPERTLYQIDKRLTEPSAPIEPQEMKVREEVDTIAQLRTQAIRRYLSVSYPLKSISVTSPFGQRTDPFSGKTANHNGLDLRAPVGTEVYAMMFGQVESVGHDKRSGIYVRLRHGNYTVCYCHLSEVLVAKSQYVTPGQTIALSGNTGRSTGPHLHLTIKLKTTRWKSPRTLDPALLLDFIRTTKQEAITTLQALEH